MATIAVRCRYDRTSSRLRTATQPVGSGVRLLVSALLVWHLAAILVGPFSLPPTVMGDRLHPVFRPYLGATYLDHSYKFFAPDPGPSHLVRYDLEFTDGTHRGSAFPSLTDEWPRLFYHRHFMLSEFINLAPPDPNVPPRTEWTKLPLAPRAAALCTQLRRPLARQVPRAPRHAVAARASDSHARPGGQGNATRRRQPCTANESWAATWGCHDPAGHGLFSRSGTRWRSTAGTVSGSRLAIQPRWPDSDLAGAMLFYTHLVWSLGLEDFFLPTGWISAEAARPGAADPYAWSYFWWINSPDALWAVHIAALVAFAMLTVGLFSRVAAVASFLAAVSYVNRVPGAQFGLDQINVMLAMYLMLGPCGACYSVDRWLARRRRRRALPPVATSVSANLAIRLIQVHMCVIYFFAGLSKLQGETWWRGDALWGAVANLEYQSWDLTWLATWPMLVAVLTHVTVFWELSFCVLVWVPKLRPLVLAMAVPLAHGHRIGHGHDHLWAGDAHRLPVVCLAAPGAHDARPIRPDEGQGRGGVARQSAGRSPPASSAGVRRPPGLPTGIEPGRPKPSRFGNKPAAFAGRAGSATVSVTGFANQMPPSAVPAGRVYWHRPWPRGNLRRATPKAAIRDPRQSAANRSQVLQLACMSALAEPTF